MDPMGQFRAFYRSSSMNKESSGQPSNDEMGHEVEGSILGSLDGLRRQQIRPFETRGPDPV